MVDGKYEIYKDAQGDWRWTYKARNGETISVSSEGYTERRGAERGIEIMKESVNSEVEDRDA